MMPKFCRTIFVWASAAIALVGGSQPAFATTQSGLTILRLGTQWDQMYVVFTTPLTDNCLFGNLYLSITSDAGKAAYSLLLTARAANKVVTRVDYTKGADGVCRIDLVEM